jgi:hypothetical protein
MGEQEPRNRMLPADIEREAKAGIETEHATVKRKLGIRPWDAW